MLLDRFSVRDGLTVHPANWRIKPPHIRWHIWVSGLKPKQKIGLFFIETNRQLIIVKNDAYHICLRRNGVAAIAYAVSQIFGVIGR
jgi:hypothetical protein